MAVSYKDINELTQKSSVAGTEKLPVSDTEFITPDQIAGIVTVDSALSSSSTNPVQNKVVDAEFSKVAYLGASEGEVSMEVPDTIEGITMNGSRVAVTEGVADLGTVVTAETDPTVPAWAKAANKPTYTASEVGALPSNTSIPSALSDLSEDTTHRVVTDTEKSTWNAKQNAITVSSSEPTSSQGSDGDIWIVI